jgi:serine/threonine-protein kinase RsbW
MNSSLVDTPDKIQTGDTHPLFNTLGMFYKEFPTDIRLLKYYTSLILQKVPPEIKGMNLLEKQVSELLKNAMQHGNKLVKAKKVKVFFAFSKEEAHLIIEDEGAGFQEIDKWNEFYKKRCECFHNPNHDEMEKYMCFRSASSGQDDHGTSLFDAIKYWNGGIVFNGKGNCVAVLKKYPKKNYGLLIE